MGRFYLALGDVKKSSLTLAVMSILLSLLSAVGQERVGDAALGALSGAVFLGPVGAVAGATIGFTEFLTRGDLGDPKRIIPNERPSGLQQ
jgi:hypothetical protein